MVSAALGQIINSTMSLLMTRCYRLVQVAKHLANTYGDQAVKVAKLAKQTGKSWPVIGKRLHEDYPYIEAEVGDTALMIVVMYIHRSIILLVICCKIFC